MESFLDEKKFILRIFQQLSHVDLICKIVTILHFHPNESKQSEASHKFTFQPYSVQTSLSAGRNLKTQDSQSIFCTYPKPCVHCIVHTHNCLHNRVMIKGDFNGHDQCNIMRVFLVKLFVLTWSMNEIDLSFKCT